jgi:hypothetical protein
MLFSIPVHLLLFFQYITISISLLLVSYAINFLLFLLIHVPRAKTTSKLERMEYQGLT